MISEAAPLREPRSREPPRSRRVRAAALALVLGSLGACAVVATRAATGTRPVDVAVAMKQEERTCWMEYRAKNGNGYKLKKKKIACDCGTGESGGGGDGGGSNPPVPSDDPQLPYFEDFEDIEVDPQQPYAD